MKEKDLENEEKFSKIKKNRIIENYNSIIKKYRWKKDSVIMRVNIYTIFNDTPFKGLGEF